jgi:hypothetical protein
VLLEKCSQALSSSAERSKSVMDKFKKAFGLKPDGSQILLFRGFVTVD